MKKSLFLCIIALLGICGFSSFDKGPKQPKNPNVYLFGFSASFADSTVYITTIQTIEGVQLEKKTKFMPNGAEYSRQFKDYLENQKGLQFRTCAIFPMQSKKEAERKYVEIQKRYLAEKSLKVVFLTPDEFKFTKYEEEWDEDEEDAPADSTSAE